jgi:hypothetical protein
LTATRALLVASAGYADQAFRQRIDADTRALEAVLADPASGFDAADRDDLLLLYLSRHGI